MLPGNGAADLIFGLAEALKPEKAVLFAPCFSEYETALRLKGCEVITIPLKLEESWLPQPDALRQALEKAGGADLVFSWKSKQSHRDGCSKGNHRGNGRDLPPVFGRPGGGRML